jgi:hypothetical protein
MSNKIWQFADERNTIKSPFEYLKEYARRLDEDTKGLFTADVSQIYREEDHKVVCSLYIVVPELRNYSYRLIETIQPDFIDIYPVQMTLYGTAKENSYSLNNVSAEEFEKQLQHLITHPLTQHILLSLRTQLQIFKDYDAL